MGPAIGDILPLALGVAISPVPIIAVILMLLSPKARTSGLAFVTGWVVGLVIAGAVVLALSHSVGFGAGGGGGSIVGSLLKIVLGLILLWLAFREWRKLPRPGEQPPLAGWMRAIDSVTMAKALGLGALLSAINPKNLSLTAAAANTIAQKGLSAGGAAFALIVFLASLSIALPVVLYLTGGSSARPHSTGSGRG
jgi:Sap, sulfolipid-1-addressing protein